MGRIALVVETYGEMDPIQLACMVNQMASYKMLPVPRPSCEREPPNEAAVPARRKVVSGDGRQALHLVHGRRERARVRQLRRKVALSK